MDADERHAMREEERAELLAPSFISHYCENCYMPIEDEEESAIFTQHLPSSYMRTRVLRRVCLECIIEVILLKPWGLREVSEMTKELKR
jgi:hypothetical protein